MVFEQTIKNITKQEKYIYSSNYCYLYETNHDCNKNQYKTYLL